MGALHSRRVLYVAVLLGGRIADSATTAYGLTLPGVYERNPAVAWLIDLFGAGGGLFVANVLAVGAVVLAAEVGVRVCRRAGLEDGSAALVLGSCYLPFAVTSFGAALYNIQVIAAA